MISNPVSVFVTGNIHKEFTYEGGNILYHFSPRDCGLSKHREWNVVFFANSKEHALDVLKRVFEFHIECAREYVKNMVNDSGQWTATFNRRNMDRIERYERYIKFLENGDVHVTLAPTNQFFVVGWASNDTLE